MAAIKKTKFDKAFDIILYSVLGLLAASYLYILIYVVSASFSDPNAVYSGRVVLWPVDFTLQGYKRVFQEKMVLLGYRNSMLYMVTGTAISTALTLMGAYALSRRDLPGRGIVTGLLVFTMFFNGGIVPLYLIVRKLKMIDTMWSLVLPGAVSVYNMIIMRTFFTTNIPEELFESARLDGCSYTTFFFRIGLPLCKAIIAVISLYYAVGYWNEYYKALIYISDAEKTTLQMVLRNILLSTQESADQSGMDYSSRLMTAEQIKYALIVASTLPIMLVYPFLQKFFAKGVMLGSIKG